MSVGDLWDQSLDLPGDEPGRIVSDARRQAVMLRLADCLAAGPSTRNHLAMWRWEAMSCRFEKRPYCELTERP